MRFTRSKWGLDEAETKFRWGSGEAQTRFRWGWWGSDEVQINPVRLRGSSNQVQTRFLCGLDDLLMWFRWGSDKAKTRFSWGSVRRGSRIRWRTNKVKLGFNEVPTRFRWRPGEVVPTRFWWGAEDIHMRFRRGSDKVQTRFRRSSDEVRWSSDEVLYSRSSDKMELRIRQCYQKRLWWFPVGIRFLMQTSVGQGGG